MHLDNITVQPDEAMHSGFHVVTALLKTIDIPHEKAALTILHHLYIVGWDVDVGNLQRCQDATIGRYGMHSSAVCMAWDILCPYMVKKHTPPCNQYNTLFGVMGTDPRAIDPKNHEHALLVVCILRDVIITCKQILRGKKKLNLPMGLRSWLTGSMQLTSPMRPI